MALATVPLMPWGAKLMVKKAVGGTYKTVKFVSEGIKKEIARLDAMGLRGTRSLEEKMSVAGPSGYGGPLSLVPNQLELEQFLTHILGGTESGGHAWAPTEALVDDLYLEVWRGAGGVTFANGAVNKATFKSGQGGLLTLDLDLLFRTAADAASATAQSMLAGLPYTHAGLVLQLNSVAYRCKELTMVIDNMLKDDHRNNSQDVQEFPTQGRKIAFSAILPASAATEDIEQYGMKTTTGELNNYALSAVYTNPDSKTMTIAAPKVQWTKDENFVSGTDQLDIKIDGEALASTTRNDELTVTMSA
jgi:hypothetical protein